MNQSAIDIQHMNLSLTREFNAPREKVFEAWTNPEALKAWFGPEGVTTQSAEVDLRVGGKYSIEMKLPEGQIVVHGGEYRVIDPPNKLKFTWVLEGQECEGSKHDFAETLVTIEFNERGSSTKLVLTHDFLPSEKSKEGHEIGWIGSLNRLGHMLA